VVPVVTECFVLSRYFDVETDIALASAKRSLQLGFRIDAKRQSCYFNQAIMEFGALQCVPKSPNCGVCVFNDSCAALQKKESRLPVKSKKLKVRNRYFILVVSDENENTLIQKRTAKGIWQNLYEFPLIETAKEEEFDSLPNRLNGLLFWQRAPQ
jgi:A/G-specific adenine glycosylase